MTNIAVALLSFNRPNYLKRYIQSIERNYNNQKYNYIFFQDGAVNKFSNRRLATEEKINQCVSILENADLANKDIRVNDHNLGIGYQRDKVFGLFDDGYDLIFHIEDDIVLGKYALYLLEIMSKQFKPNLTSTYRIEAYDNIENPKEKLNKVITDDECYWWIKSIWEEAYREIEDDWNRYLDIIKEIDYTQRPHDKIFNKFPESDASLSDSVCDVFFTKHNIKNIFPVVSRANYIGEEGIHFIPEQYDEKDTGDEGPAEFEKDRNIDEWQILVNNF